MLQFRDDDFVAGRHLFAETSGDEVDCFGCAACEDDFARVFGVQEARDLPPRIFKGGGAFGAEAVCAAMHIRVVMTVEVIHRVQSDPCFLRA